jgi:hypothetical protein
MMAINVAVCQIARFVLVLKLGVDVMSHTATGKCFGRMALRDGSARTGVL